jgi:NAD(P)-dependent dehydrogenase (short-subunit alcohol dehydrogenase family)
VIITGANTGIGKANAIDLAKRGGKVYIACRDTKRGEEALKDIKQQSGSENVFFMRLDLGSMDSIRDFSKKYDKNNFVYLKLVIKMFLDFTKKKISCIFSSIMPVFSGIHTE